MKTILSLRTWMFTLVMLIGSYATAADIDRLLVQGYLRTSAGVAVSGAQTVTFVLRNGASTIKTWTNETVTCTNGLFSKELTGLTAGEIATFASTTGVVTVTVSSTTGAFATANLNASILNGAVPTALQAGSLHANAKAATSAGAADVGKAVVLDAAGKIDNSMIDGSALTTINATNLSSGTVPVARLSTAATSGSTAADNGKVVILDGSGLINTSSISTAATSGATTTDNGKVVILNGSGLINTSSIDAVATSAGAGSAGKLVKLNGSGLVDSTMLPPTLGVATASMINLFDDLVSLPNTIATGVPFNVAVPIFATGTVTKVAGTGGRTGLVRLTSGAASGNHAGLFFCQSPAMDGISIATGQTSTFEATFSAAPAVATGVATNTAILRVGIFNTVAAAAPATTKGLFYEVTFTATGAATYTSSAVPRSGDGAALVNLVAADTTAFNSAIKVKLTLTPPSTAALEINGVPVTITGTPAFGATLEPTCAGVDIVKTSAGTSNFNVIVDHMAYTQTQSR